MSDMDGFTNYEVALMRQNDQLSQQLTEAKSDGIKALEECEAEATKEVKTLWEMIEERDKQLTEAKDENKRLRKEMDFALSRLEVDEINEAKITLEQALKEVE